MILEEALLNESILLETALTLAKKQAKAQNKPLAAYLVDEKLVSEDLLADLAARLVGTVVVDLEQGTLDTAAVRVLPREVCQQHLVIVVARSPSGVRVAFADPTDDEARLAVFHAVSGEVQAVVATVSGIRAAMKRDHTARSEWPSEPTRKMDDRRALMQDVPSQEPLPLNETRTRRTERTTSEPTLEQRFEALLLTLVEAGVITRADYAEVLKRITEP